MSTQNASGYYNSAELCERFKISTRTLDRWMKREKNPFPKPTIQKDGGIRLWAKEIVWKWEQKISNTQPEVQLNALLHAS